MVKLNQLRIFGREIDVTRVQKLFGQIKFEFAGEFDYKSQIHTTFNVIRYANYYINPRKPLYVLIPGKKVLCAWPEKNRYEEVKYGTGSYRVPGLGLFLSDGTGLYICLTPTTKTPKVGDLGI